MPELAKVTESSTALGTLSARQQRAAVLVAEDRITDREIAKSIGVVQFTIERWKRMPAFKEAVAAENERLLAAVRAEGIAHKQNRLDSLVDLHRRLEQVLEERAGDPVVEGVPGGKTGLIVPTPMLVKVYDAEGSEGSLLSPQKTTELVQTYAVDTATLKEMRELKKHAAQEMGQWSERHELSGRDGGPVGVQHSGGVVVKGEGFDYAKYEHTFASVLAGFNGGEGPPPSEALNEPMDPGDADRQTGRVPHDPVS